MLRTLLAGASLAALYLLVSQLTRPLLTTPQGVWQQTELPGRGGEPVPRKRVSPVFEEAAEKWFPGDAWVRNANGRVRDGSRLLFFQDHQLINEGRSLQASPVAMLWQGEGDEAPITATADSAQLDAEVAISIGKSSMGRLTSGLLSGVVRVAGPKGMRIEGRAFHYSADAMRIWTSQAVKIAWDGHTAVAEGGAEIELSGGENPERTGLMSVTDVQRIRLLGRVTCDMLFADRSAKREPVPLKVSAANGMEYFVPTREATFSGFGDRELRPDNQVMTERPLSDGTVDRLYCSRLVLQLQPKVTGPEQTGSTPRLTLGTISAEGRRVLFRSEQQGLTASMSQLRYRLEDNILELIGRPVAATGKPVFVQIEQRGRRLTAPVVTIGLDAEREVRFVKCAGPGTLLPALATVSAAGVERGDVASQSAESTAAVADGSAMEAAWSEALTLMFGEQDVLTLRGAARVADRGRGLTLTGTEIQLSLEPRGQSQAVGRGEAGVPGLAGPSLAELRPRQLRATGGVRLESPGFSGNAFERLTVDFVEGLASGTTASAAAAAGANSGRGLLTSSGVGGEEVGSSRAGAGKTEFSCDVVEARLKNQAGGRPEFDTVWLRGNVAISHEAVRSEDSFTAQGNLLHAAADAAGRRSLHLSGDPASVIRSNARIDGPRIDLLETADGEVGGAVAGISRGGSAAAIRGGEATVEGGGRLRMVVSRGPDGRELPQPAPLDIYWNERMKFAGRTAHFIGSVRAVLNNETDVDAELTCAGMKVHLLEQGTGGGSKSGDRFRLISKGTGGTADPREASEIERMECEGRVVVDLKMKSEGVVTGRHHAEFADLVLHGNSGEFEAAGPGVVESVQPDERRRLTTSNRAVARANTPVRTPDEACVYVRATFIGNLEGNYHDRFVRLRQHVRGVFGPVATLQGRLNVDGLGVNELPENCGAMGCENLTVSITPGAEGGRSSFSLVAESNAAGSGRGTRAPCRLESRLFSGDADQITYDHSKQQYILRADDGRQARVTYVPNNGEPQSLTGRRFEYYADRNHLNANHVSGVQATGGL
jgi:lipopolysaccharide export system protein LptA